MANQKASLLDLVTKHHMTVVGASLRSMDQARQSNPVFLDIFSRMDRHKTSANRQQQKLKLVDDVMVEVTGLTTRIDLSEVEGVCYLVMGSWTFSLVILSNVSVLACDDINFFVGVVGGWKWRSLAIVEVVAFQTGHAVPLLCVAATCSAFRKSMISR